MSSRVIESKKKKIEAIASTVANSLKSTVYEISVKFRKENTGIYVKIDNGGDVSHNDCAEFSREFINSLDSEGILDKYTVEVSSPGLKRKIRGKDEFKRFKDSPVKIIYFEGDEKTFASKGILKEVKENSVVVKEDGKETEIDYGVIKSANLDY